MVLAGKRILVVDDSALARKFVETTLKGLGCEVITMDSPLGATGVVRRERPDMVIMDLVMPGLRGDEVVQVMKRFKFAGEIPIIIFSSRPDQEVRAAVERCGADGYIPKTRDTLKFVASLMRQMLKHAKQNRAAE